MALKINGDIFMTMKPTRVMSGYNVYRVTLKGGPMDKHQTLAGNTTTVFMNGHRYDLNPEGDFVYSPQGQN